ncbi:hypothetical protein [Kribbella sp. CA-293567]|uniref:hypothetical protein n=1 Tax=Kribbella sp. CA-293567 TaxID=3002436 RepID=UPI0022DD5E26|nr:hypothetical protein [Kribbella sp. CA-293567]WBQ06486.1 hypothetical protein OX958_06755 [Kribbella sp. CA-293567]
MSVSEVEQDEYAKNVQDYADQAVTAVQQQAFDVAATIWESILDDEDMRSLYDEDSTAHMRARADWARGFEQAWAGNFEAAAERWQRVVDTGSADTWFGSDGAQELSYNLALAYTRAGNPDKAETALAGLSESEQAEIRAAAGDA